MLPNTLLSPISQPWSPPTTSNRQITILWNLCDSCALVLDHVQCIRIINMENLPWRKGNYRMDETTTFVHFFGWVILFSGKIRKILEFFQRSVWYQWICFRNFVVVFVHFRRFKDYEHFLCPSRNNASGMFSGCVVDWRCVLFFDFMSCLGFKSNALPSP